MSNKVMNTNNAPGSKFAEVFVTRNGKRNAMLMCKDFEGKANISTQDVPRIGSVIMGKKPTTVELSFTMTIYKCQILTMWLTNSMRSADDPVLATEATPTCITTINASTGDVLL